MKHFHRNRLNKLADFLETEVPRKHFDMRTWRTGDYRARECGSAACAMGWAVELFPRNLGWDSFGDPLDKATGRDGMGAAEAFFGLSPGEADSLFISRRGHRTPKQVAKNLRKAAL